MNIDITHQILSFFNNVADLTNDYVDRIELEPIKLYVNFYITGLKRNFYYATSIEAHVKELRKLQLKTNTTATTNNEDGYYFMEADNDLWMPIAMLSEKLTQNTLNEFMENFDKVNEFHVLDVKYKIKGDNNTHMETILYQNKRTACKDAIKFRKENEQCSTKFHTFINENCKEHKLTDFEILTAAIE